MSRKVFTADEVLTAADVNTLLMDQTVMSFAGTAARGSAIASPVEGMTTFLEDVDQVEIWSGSAWRIPYGMTPLVSQSFTSTTSVIITGCFSAKFDNYFVQVTQSGGGNQRLQLRTGGTTLASGYSGSVVYGTGASALSTTRSTLFFEAFGEFTSSYLYRPFLTQSKGFHGIGTSGGTTPGLDSGFNGSTTSYESLVLSYGSNATGTIRVYGLRN